jgi:hypothetical protein
MIAEWVVCEHGGKLHHASTLLWRRVAAPAQPGRLVTHGFTVTRGVVSGRHSVRVIPGRFIVDPSAAERGRDIEQL